MKNYAKTYFQNFPTLVNGKANQTEAWIQRSQEEIIESQRVYFHLILYCCLLAGICEVTAATSILRQRPIHCCCSVRQFTVCAEPAKKKLALICPLTMIVFDVPQDHSLHCQSSCGWLPSVVHLLAKASTHYR